MKKLLSAIISAVMVLSMAATAFASEVDTSVLTGPNMIDMLEYYNPFDGLETSDDVLAAGIDSTKTVMQFGNVLNADSVKTYKKAVSSEKKNPTSESGQNIINAFNELVQETAFADRIVYLWGDKNVNMPYPDGETGEPLVSGSFIVKYLAENPAEAKGNILLCSGGDGVSSCGNEGFQPALRFNELGYNCFVFQVRSGSCTTEDSIIDVQRALKMVRYLVETEGYGGADLIVGNGYSAGNLRIMAMLSNMTADDNASKYASGYTPDEIDAYSSDMDVFINVYGGPFEPLPSDIPHMPALYMCSGSEDEATIRLNAMHEQFKDIVPCGQVIFEGAGHGFGAGLPGGSGYAEGCETWPSLADEFLMTQVGFSNQYK